MATEGPRVGREGEHMEAEQEIAERMEILSRLLRGAIHRSPDMLAAVAEPIDDIIRGVAEVAHVVYEQAGSPYGNTDEGFWRWWGEHRQLRI